MKKQKTRVSYSRRVIFFGSCRFFPRRWKPVFLLLLLFLLAPAAFFVGSTRAEWNDDANRFEEIQPKFAESMTKKKKKKKMKTVMINDNEKASLK